MTTAVETPQVLHVGCGRKRYDWPELSAYVGLNGSQAANVTHLDADARLEPDLVCTLGAGKIPMPTDSADIVIAWHVLEHVGRQGESREWFFAFEELYRVLKPNGLLYAECPYAGSAWEWADPTHTRSMNEYALTYFNQDNYRIPGSMISPYRIACDLRFVGMAGMERGWAQIRDLQDPKVSSLRFAMRAHKPLTPWWED